MEQIAQCENCRNERIQVTDSRNRGDHIWRRRKCLDCGTNFYTREYREKTVEADDMRQTNMIEEIKSMVKTLSDSEKLQLISEITGEN